MKRLQAVIAVCLIGMLGFSSSARDRPPSPAGEAHRVRFFKARTLERATVTARGRPAVPPIARVVIVPHHWLAGDLIVRGLSPITGIDRVVLIGPDHANAGVAQVTTVRWRWSTPYGIVEPDEVSIEKLVTRGLAATDSNVFASEHSIDGLVPAVASFFPDARLVPLAVRSKMDAQRVDVLAEAIFSSMDGHTLVVASVDFSHHLVDPLARARNVETITAIEELDLHRILRFGNEHMDSTGSIGLVVEIARRLGATEFTVLESSTSTDRGGLSTDVTSYILGYFAAPA